MSSERSIKVIEIIKDTSAHAVSFDVMRELEESFKSDKINVAYINRKNKFISKLYKTIVTKFGLSLQSLVIRRGTNSVFSIQMGPDFGKILPFCSDKNITNAYFFDIWPNTFTAMEAFLTHSGITNVFLSSSYAAEYFTNRGFDNVSWVPEGVKYEEYYYKAFEDKDIDVLELGRRHQKTHNSIVEVLRADNKKHLYEKSPGKIVFPNKEQFITGMARSKISLCFPKSETDPEAAGPVSTMTNRFLQSMASKCLVVGSSPQEMVQLFGYDPVVQIDKSAPAAHLLDILYNFQDYHDLIEKNYINVRENHTWENRCNTILKIIING